MQEAAGDVAGVEFGELRSLLADQSQFSYVKLAPIITKMIKEDFDQFQDQIEPYILGQIRKWPDHARAIPIEALVAQITSHSTNYPSGVLWIAEHAKRHNMPNGRLHISPTRSEFAANKNLGLGKVMFEPDFEFMDSLIKSDVFRNTPLGYAIFYGLDFELDDKEQKQILANINLRHLAWQTKNDAVEQDYGMLSSMRQGNWGKLLDVKHIEISVKYTNPDLFEQHIAELYERGGNFELLELDVVRTRRFNFNTATLVLQRLNAELGQGAQRIIARSAG
jgi:hypothetical protein